jgi:hypothetical protein
VTGDGEIRLFFLSPQTCLEVFVKFSPEQVQRSSVSAAAHAHDRALRLHPAAGVVCPGCGARIGKPCVSTVPFCGVGAIGTPIEGVHAERIAAALEQGAA